MSRSHSEPSLFDDDMIEKSPRAKKPAIKKKVIAKKTVAKTVTKKVAAVAKKTVAAKKKAPARKKSTARTSLTVASPAEEKVEATPRKRAKSPQRDTAPKSQESLSQKEAPAKAIAEAPSPPRPEPQSEERPQQEREGRSQQEREGRSQQEREERPQQEREGRSQQEREGRPQQEREERPQQEREERPQQEREERAQRKDRPHRDFHSQRDDSNRRHNKGRRDRHSNDSQNRRPQDAPGEPRDRGPRKEAQLGPPSPASGMVELSPKGFGFLRQPERNFYQTNKDTFIPPDLVRTYGLRDGMMLDGEACRGPRGLQLTSIEKINQRDPKDYQDLPIFEELTAVNPSKRWILETSAKRHTTRIIDMMTPVGRGQRGLIVAPPRTGKTTLIQHIAEAILENYPEARVIILLIDERPEEVTEITRALPKAEVVASSNDNDTRTHMRIAELTIERAKRLVEVGEDVFILLDSITRLARAFNRANRGKGGMNKGGLSNRALEVPRRLFAAARNTREAGSLTILATALIDTGTMMDEAIFQEFKGTGNMELVLDKKISQSYVYPAVDIFKSGTRREELLLPPHQLEKIVFIRRGLSGHKPIEAIERLLSIVERFPSNAQMLLEIKQPSA